MNQIMDALEENHVNRIGVYGMGGVGKTMLVKEILRKIGEKKTFDEVVISTISQTPDLKIIQGQLADMLDLKLEQETIEGRALKLRKRLMNEKSILVVLDDVWEYIDLETIGIPSVVDHTGCKILFTARDKHLLSNEMNTNKTFEIKVLEKDESWNLFETAAGEIVEDRKPIADQIVTECARLPIAITTVAKALRNKPSSIWNDALDQLKKPVGVNNIRGMDKRVYSSLKLSYDYLEGEEVKLLFLLCSMFPEDFPISVEDDLQGYAIAMGFLHGVDTIAQGRRRITKLVDDLISSSLLLQHEFGDNYVKMHDLVRDVAILISSKNDKIRTLSYVKRRSKEWEEEKLSDNYTAVHVGIQDSHSSLQKLLIPKVQLLSLHAPYLGLYEVVETFFEDMKELKCLELRSVKIPLFPSSLSSFANVRLLHLHNCELGNIDMIGELKRLEILSFQRSNIVQIPTTINQLTQLKVLDLSWCEQLNIIPPNILSRLTKLEELYLGTFVGWEREEWYEGRKNASLSELRDLPHLYALNLRIQDEKIIPKQLFSREMNLKKFQISIGSLRGLFITLNKNSNFLRLNMESGCCLHDWIKSLLKMSEELCLQGSISTKTLQSKFDVNDSSHLKHLKLCDNLEIKQFIHEETKPLQKILFNLESLELEKVKNLESIVHGYDRESAFHKLRRVIVWNCNELKNLFFNCTLDDILNLEEINIFCCGKMEVMFVMEMEETNNQIEFTHLKSLTLHGYFPQLQKFCSKIEQPETITICNGGSFFSEQVSLPVLEKLYVHGADNLKTIWHNIHIPNSFSKLKQVLIDSCNSLETVFPSNIMSMLTGLNTLYIQNCNLLQGIFEVQDLNITESSVPKMPKLTHTWKLNSHKNILSLPNLSSLNISKCRQLNTLLPSPMSFKKLLDLRVDHCHQLTHLLDSSVARALVQLQYLGVGKCKKMITVIAGGDELEGNDEIVFNNLKSVILLKFSKLANFYSGKCIIRFPCLHSVRVEDCPEMKVFSMGTVATPALPTKRIQFFSSFSWPRDLKVNSEEFFVKDINVIFRQLWEDNSDTANIQHCRRGGFGGKPIE